MRVTYGPLIDTARGRLGNLVFRTQGQTGIVSAFEPPHGEVTNRQRARRGLMRIGANYWTAGLEQTREAALQAWRDWAPPGRSARHQYFREFLRVDATDAAVGAFAFFRPSPSEPKPSNMATAAGAGGTATITVPLPAPTSTFEGYLALVQLGLDAFHLDGSVRLPTFFATRQEHRTDGQNAVLNIVVTRAGRYWWGATVAGQQRVDGVLVNKYSAFVGGNLTLFP